MELCVDVAFTSIAKEPAKRACAQCGGLTTNPSFASSRCWGMANKNNAFNAKLTADQVVEIRKLLAQGTPLAKIADLFPVTVSISHINAGRAWGHLQGANAAANLFNYPRYQSRRALMGPEGGGQLKIKFQPESRAAIVATRDRSNRAGRLCVCGGGCRGGTRDKVDGY